VQEAIVPRHCDGGVELHSTEEADQPSSPVRHKEQQRQRPLEQKGEVRLNFVPPCGQPVHETREPVG
jgi:hypothetical protein